MENKENFAGLTRREFLYLSGIGMTGLTLAGIPELGHAQEKPKYGGRLRYANRWNSAGLDVHKNQEFADYENYCFMYGALTEQGPLPQVEIYPMLAESWEISKDGREYLFALRKGVNSITGRKWIAGM